MTNEEQDYIVDLILCGCFYLSDGMIYRNPSRKSRFFAHQIYQEAYREAKFLPLETLDQIETKLNKMQLWSRQDSTKLFEIEEDINLQKKKYFNERLKTEKTKANKFTLDKLKEEHIKLLNRRHQLDHMTCEYIANTAKIRFLTGCGLYVNKKRYWTDPINDFKKPDKLIDFVMLEINNLTPHELQVRRVARSGYWRSIWYSKGDSLFGTPRADYTPLQKNLVSWSIFYDNIAESSECPENFVIENDDMLDGWVLIQKDKRRSQEKGRLAESLANGRDGEIFVEVDTPEDARRIHELNNSAGELLRKQRLNIVNKKGVVDEVQLPSLDRLG